MSQNDFLDSFLNAIPRNIGHSCSYIAGLWQQSQELIVEEAIPDALFEEFLSQGMRHFGCYFFRYACQNCGQCLPIRIPVKEFQISKSQRRVLKKAEKISYILQKPSYSPEKLEMYCKHKRFQFNQPGTTALDYKTSFVLGNPSQTQEFTYFYEGIPIGYGYVDILPSCMSSIYFFYDPAYAEFSLGTYSLLAELQYALEHQKDYLYLGYYIYNNHSMRYKAEFRPCEVFSPFGTWTPFRNAKGEYLLSLDEARCQVPAPPEAEERFIFEEEEDLFEDLFEEDEE